MPNIALVIEYDGTNFCGWQKQPGDRRSIQEELQRAVETVLRHPIRSIHASGRTDSGVHARGQVVNFLVDTVPDLDALSYSVSCILRDEVSVVSAAVVPDSFHSRASAIKKQYSYTILHRLTPPTLDRGQVWHLRGDLDVFMMMEDAKWLEGVHDFTSFRGSGCASRSPIREICESEIIHKPPYVTYRVVGRGFLKQMVRNIVGSLVDRARGRMGLSLAEILEAKNRRIAGVTAPAHGLRLDWVEYEPEIMRLLGIAK